MHKHGFYSGRSRGDGRREVLKKYKHSPWFSEMTGRKGARIERGETQYLILDALNEKKRHGYDIMQTIEEKTGGMYRPSAGTVYPALQKLEDLEMISSSVEGKRKVFELTEKGKEEIEAKGALLEDIYEDMGRNQHSQWEAFFEKAHQELMPMFRSVSKSFRRGRMEADKADKVLEIIRGAVTKVIDVLNS